MKSINRSDLRHGRVHEYIQKQARMAGMSFTGFVDAHVRKRMAQGEGEQKALEALIADANNAHRDHHHGRVEHG